MTQPTNPNPNPNQPTLASYSPRIDAPILAVQFLGQLDPGTAGALAPASTDPVASPGTFLGLPVREEPFRHVNPANLPTSYLAAPVDPLARVRLASQARPLIEIAVLVPTTAGGIPAFPGDWIVQDSHGLYSVWSDTRFRAEFDVPAAAPGSGSGSGTGRYGEGDNWTQHSDGTDYPGSYGVGPEGIGSDGQPLKPFAPGIQPDILVVGSSFRILRVDQTVDPTVHVITAINLGVVTYESNGETLEVSRDHIVAVKA